MRYFFENFSLDTDRRELRRGTDVVAIAPQVFDLLGYLIGNRERVVSKDDLIDTIWQGRVVSDVALTTRLNAARKAIGEHLLAYLDKEIGTCDSLISLITALYFSRRVL